MTAQQPADADPTWPEAQDVIRLLHGRWCLPILSKLDSSPCRYQDLFEALDDVSHKVLTETLQHLERDGLVTRTLDTDRRRSTTVYQLTDLARSLDRGLTVLADWSREHWQNITNSINLRSLTAIRSRRLMTPNSSRDERI